MADAQIRHFGGLLQTLEDGQLMNDLGDKLAELNGKLQRHAAAMGKAKGELRLTLKMAADGQGIVQIDGEIVTKEPKPARSRSVLWLSKEGNLTPENPRQTKLALREVSKPSEPIDAGAESAKKAKV